MLCDSRPGVVTTECTLNSDITFPVIALVVVVVLSMDLISHNHELMKRLRNKSALAIRTVSRPVPNTATDETALLAPTVGAVLSFIPLLSTERAGLHCATVRTLVFSFQVTVG